MGRRKIEIQPITVSFIFLVVLLLFSVALVPWLRASAPFLLGLLVDPTLTPFSLILKHSMSVIVQ